MPIDSEHIVCRKCGYTLKGLTVNVCPECGLAFDPDDPSTTGRRAYLPWKYVLIIMFALVLVGPIVVGFLALIALAMRWLSR